MSGLWLRLYTEIRHDRKLRRLPPAQRWLWVAILTMAKESPQQGKLLLSEGVPVKIEDIADDAAIPLDQVELGLNAFINQRMLENIDSVWCLVNWDKRQFVSDSSTKRVKKHRAKQKKNDVPSIITETLQKQDCNVSVTPPETETETETEIIDQVVIVEEAAPEKTETAMKEIQTALQDAGILMPSPTQVLELVDWTLKHSMDLEAVLYAIKITALADKRRVDYICGTLRNWHNIGVRTKTQAEAERQKYAEGKGVLKHGRDPTNRANNNKNNAKTEELQFPRRYDVPV